MKKYILLLICVISLFCGCGMTIKESDRYIYSTEILRCFDEKDTKGLKDMFCPKVLENIDNLDVQIENAMEFYEGKMISHGTITGGEGESVRDGIVTEKRISPRINDIETSAGEKYEILFYVWIICDEGEKRVGISEITITNETGEKCVIGDYYLVNPEMK